MNANEFIPTIDIMAALKTFLAAIVLTPAEGETPEVKLFDKVEFYTMPNLVKALEDLRIFKQRVCLIVPSGDEFDNEVEGRQLTSDADYEFVLLMADRDYGRRQDASTGDDKRPGVIRIKDIVIKELLGENLGFAPRRLNFRPIDGGPVLLSEKQREEASGREAWQITWQCDAGTCVFES